MSQNIHRTIDDIRLQIAIALGLDRTRWLAADDQTRLSWAKPVKSVEDLPEAYRAFFDGLKPEEREPFPYMVLTPTYKGFLTPENEKLICRIGESLHILESAGGRLTEVEFPLESIHFMEAGTILLSSWLTIDGADALGKPAAVKMKFNSVTEHLFAPLVEGFRDSLSDAAEGAPGGGEAAEFLSLQDVNFKFMNFARRSLRPGERVVQSILQPELRRKFRGFFFLPFSRQITPAHLAILTDSELILIRDDETKHWLKERPYGGIWRYVPLNKIRSVSLMPGEEGVWKLTMRLPQNRELNILYHDSKKKEAQALLEQIKRRCIS